MKVSKGNVLVAMSGGVDSSIAAALLKRQGYACRGVFMRLGVAGEQADEPERFAAAAAEAQAVAEQLGVTLEVIDCREDLRGIIDYFIDEYRRGRTPNPCVMCNRRLKFGRLLQHARATGCDYLATGHYAQVLHEGEQARLRRAVYVAKDQSYVLFGMGPENLRRVLLPLGQYRKDEVRRLAREMALTIHDKAESQEICFIPNDDYAAVLAAEAPELVRKGPVVNTAGEILGEHTGIYQYTVGQRRGLGIALGKPAYVVSLDAATNTVVLGDNDDLAQQTLRTEDVIWLIDPPGKPLQATVQIRYNHRGAAGTVTSLDDGRTVQVDFDKPVRAVTPGQAAVFYDNEGGVLGGGWIAK